ncbi:hypothetical protein [Pseudaquabacterium rugosum]|uniref:Uncharacterized protein n=1 Tax=Pseudaquabacterium rugosum TaxID=2984194 RepID=A0ABU9BE52_9BURK
MELKPAFLLYGAAGLVVLGLAVYVAKKGVAGVAVDVVDAAADAAAAVGGKAVDLAAESVNRTGEALGIPRTDETECERAMREGRTWDASFACPAATFLRYAVTGQAPDAGPYGQTAKP